MSGRGNNKSDVDFLTLCLSPAGKTQKKDVSGICRRGFAAVRNAGKWSM